MDCYQSDSTPLFWIHATIPSSSDGAARVGKTMVNSLLNRESPNSIGRSLTESHRER